MSGERRTTQKRRTTAQTRSRTTQARRRTTAQTRQRTTTPQTRQRTTTPQSTAAGRLNAIRQRRIQSRRMIIGITSIVVAFCIVVGAQMVNKHNKLSKLKEQERKLTEQYEQQLQLSEELKEQEAYVQTDDYIEEMARRLGLLYPDEVIFKPED